MKKITLLIFLMTISFGNSQTIDGTWRMTPVAGSFGVGPGQGNISWWSIPEGEIALRACYFDDDYVFNADGTFSNVQGDQTWLEGWQGANDCGTPVAPHNGSAAATWAYDATAKTLVITGTGAYLGLPKVFNGGELNNPANAPASITYTVSAITSASMTLDVFIGGEGWWRFLMSKQGQAPSCTDGIMNGDETGVDCGGSCAPCLAQINLPITFDGGTVNYAVTDFGGTASSLVVDPTDAANMVIKTIKTVGAEHWAGTTLSTNSGLSAPIPFTASNRKMYLRVWSPAAGTPVMLKVEDHLDPSHSVETITNTTVAGGWQSIEFNFDNERPGTAAFNTGYVYDKASVFFDYVAGGPLNSTEVIYYFDDLSYGTALLGTTKFETSKVRMYPNPVKNTLSIEANSTIQKVSVYNILGQEVMTKSPKSNSATLQTNSLQKGVYIVKTDVDGKVSNTKIVKE
jgi:hypothetical protein